MPEPGPLFRDAQPLWKPAPGEKGKTVEMPRKFRRNSPLQSVTRFISAMAPNGARTLPSVMK